MSNNNNYLKSFLDPDYEFASVTAERKKIRREKDQTQALQKASELLNQQFDIELKERQKQLEIIQDRISRAQKTLHLLRYVVITSYYNRKDLEISFPETSSLTENSVDIQKRIHPAVKKLIGKDNLSFSTLYSTGLRNRQKVKQNLNTNVQEKQETSSNDSKDEEKKRKCSTQQPEINVDRVVDTIRNRKRKKYRILIGNISKWVPSDSSTHKWMVYVRGPKENPNISSIVEKVIFHLHPSYKPHDVVELKSSPFHLSRRGWGEFPLRVKIYFNSSLNKPVDVIHNLKLDRTYSGQQTLGNETIVDVFLYEDEVDKNEKEKSNFEGIDADLQVPNQENSSYRQNDELLEEKRNTSVFKHCIKEENTSLCKGIMDDIFDKASSMEYTKIIKEEVNNEDYKNCYEHDYCFKEDVDVDEMEIGEVTIQEFGGHILDHDYCLPPSPKNISNFLMSDDQTMNECTNVINDADDDFIENSSLNYLEDFSESRQHIFFQEKNDTESNKPTVSRKTEKYKNYPTSILKLDPSKYKIYIPIQHFRTTIEILPVLLKRLPIVTKKTYNMCYRSFHPYSASTLAEYSSWIYERRLSAEWFRAKLIKEFITSVKLMDCEKWSTKSIIMFARAYGFTPLANYNIFKKSHYTANFQLLIQHPHVVGAPLLRHLDGELDVEGDGDVQTDVHPKKRLSKLVDPNFESECAFIRQCAFDVGVVLKPEEIVPGLLFNSAERVLLQAVMNLAENLILKARASQVLNGNYREKESILTVEDIKNVLHHRPELSLIKYETINMN